jgi:predicted ATPase
VPDREELRPLAVTLYRHTAGHPLFMVATVEEWLSQVRRSVGNGDGQEPESSAIFNGLIPERLRQLVSVQMERLPSREQRVLEAASVAGFEFSAAEVAAGLTADDVATEEQCERLVRQQQFLRPAGVSEWPDGTVATRYEFRHAVYQSLWQERVKAGRWRRYHQLIGERKEAAYGERANEIAAELALHFEQGGDYRKAIRYYHQAARTALTRSANAEAIAQLTKGLTLLERVPNILERPKQELALRITFGDVLRQAKGFGAPEVEQAYARAQALC